MEPGGALCFEREVQIEHMSNVEFTVSEILLWLIIKRLWLAQIVVRTGATHDRASGDALVNSLGIQHIAMSS